MASPAKSSQDSVLWVLAADGRQARFFEYREEDRIVPSGDAGPGQYSRKKEVTAPVLEPLADMTLRAEPPQDFNAAPRHTSTPHGDTKDDIKQKLMRDIAAHLEQASIGKRFGRLVIAAPPRMLGDLRPLLNPHIQKRIVAEISGELTRLKPHELLAHIQKNFPKVLKEVIG